MTASVISITILAIMQILILTATALGVGAFSSLVGVGGGFLFMPILLVMYPSKSHEALTFISMFAVLVTTTAATINNARMKRIDYKAGLILGACTVPTAAAARFALHGLDRLQFIRTFGFVLIAIGVFILWSIFQEAHRREHKSSAPKSGWLKRKIKDSTGKVYEYAFPLPVAVGTAVSGGFIASFFGIGGGPLVMPMLTQLLRVPLKVAVSTSILILAASAFTGVTTDIARHLGAGTLAEIPLWLALAAGIGAFAGAQIGSHLSNRISGKPILILLAVAVIIAGARLVTTPQRRQPPEPQNTPMMQSEHLIYVDANNRHLSAREVWPC